MGRRTIKNYPSPRLMQTIGATKQSVSEAIGELVANCFDARVDNERLNIVIDLRGAEIAVIDDGRGMTDDILEHAVCIAEDMSGFLDRGKGAKGHFGMGFKTSCSTLGKFYEIFTRPVGGDAEYHVEFDIADYSRRPAGADAWDVVIEDGPRDPSSPLGDAAHGSAFVIRGLNDPNFLVSAVQTYLGNAFKGHLESGDAITVVTDDGVFPAIPEKRTYLEGSIIPIDVRCGENDELHITGWAGLETKVHNDGIYGFNIYRHGQLVDAWNQDWFRSHLMTSRLSGEVNMDFLDATFYKQGLQQTEKWILASQAMREFLKPISSASQWLSAKHRVNDPVLRRERLDSMRADYGLDPLPPGGGGTTVTPPSAGGSTETPPGQGPDGSNLPETDNPGGGKPEGGSTNVSDKVKNLIKEDELVLKEGTLHIPISLMESKLSERMNMPFDYVYEDELEDEPELQAILFTDHRLFGPRENMDTLRTLAVADAIYRVLVERIHMEPRDAFNIKNEWIAKRIESKGR